MAAFTNIHISELYFPFPNFPDFRHDYLRNRSDMTTNQRWTSKVRLELTFPRIHIINSFSETVPIHAIYVIVDKGSDRERGKKDFFHVFSLFPSYRLTHTTLLLSVFTIFPSFPMYYYKLCKISGSARKWELWKNWSFRLEKWVIRDIDIKSFFYQSMKSAFIYEFYLLSPSKNIENINFQKTIFFN